MDRELDQAVTVRLEDLLFLLDAANHQGRDPRYLRAQYCADMAFQGHDPQETYEEVCQGKSVPLIC